MIFHWLAPPASARVRARRRMVAAMWTVGTIVALWMPPPPQPGLDWPWLDKAVHFGLFGGAAALWCHAGTRLFAVAAGVLALAALTELGQGLLPWERTPQLADFGFDLLGAALGAVGARAVAKTIGPNDDAPGGPEASRRNGRDSNPR